MIGLSSEKWIEYYKKRADNFSRSAQVESDDPSPEELRGHMAKYRVIPYDRPRHVTYVPGKSEQISSIQVPLLRGTPLQGFDINAPTEAAEIYRPKLEGPWLSGWRDIFEAGDKGRQYREKGSSKYLPEEVYRGLSGPTRWVGDVAGGLASPDTEAGEPYRIIYPGLRPKEIALPKTFEQYGHKNMSMNNLNAWLGYLVKTLRHIHDEGPTGEKARQNLQKLYSKEHKDAAWNTLLDLMDSMFTRSDDKDLVDEPSLLIKTLSKMVGSHYVQTEQPLSYFQKFIREEIKSKTSQEAKRRHDDLSIQWTEEKEKEKSERTFDEILPVKAQNAHSEAELMQMVEKERDENIAVVRDMRGGNDLINELNEGFGKFLISGGIRLSGPVMLDLIPKLFPEGRPQVIDIGKPDPIPKTWCPSCGEETLVDPRYMSKEDKKKFKDVIRKAKIGDVICTNPNCRNIETSSAPQVLSKKPEFDVEAYKTAIPMRQQVASMVYRPLLAYLETERQNPYRPEEQKDMIRRLMVGLSIPISHQGMHMHPVKSKDRRFSAYTYAFGDNDIVAIPYSLRASAADPEKQEMMMYQKGIRLGELIGGIGWLSSMVARSVGTKGSASVLPADAARKAPLKLMTHPSSRAQMWAQYVAQNIPEPDWSDEAAPQTLLYETQEKRSRVSSDRFADALRRYNQTLAAYSMFLLSPTAERIADMNAEGLMNTIAPALRSYARLIGESYGMDPQHVLSDLVSMYDHFRNHAKADSIINYDMIKDPLIMKIISSGGYDEARHDEIVEQLVAEEASPEANEKEKGKAKKKVEKAIDGVKKIENLTSRIDLTLEKVQEEKFDLGWQIVANLFEPKPNKKTTDKPAPKFKAVRLHEQLGGLMAEAPVSGASESIFSKGSPWLQQKYYEGTQNPPEGEQMELTAEKRALYEDLAMGITGLFGFGGDYNGHPGTLTSPIKPQTITFSIEDREEFQDGQYDMKVGKSNIPVTKHTTDKGIVWEINDPSKLGSKGIPANSKVKIGGEEVTVKTPIAMKPPAFTMNISTPLPDGYYQMFIGDDMLTVSKVTNENGPVWMVYDENKLSGEDSYPTGTDIKIDEYIPNWNTGGNKGFSETIYLTSENYSPEAIARRWGLNPALIRNRMNLLTFTAVDKIFGQMREEAKEISPGWGVEKLMDPVAVAKDVFIALLPSPLHQTFIRSSFDKSSESGFDPNEQEPTGRAVGFIYDLYNWFNLGRSEKGYNDIRAHYPDVPEDMINKVITEFSIKWGPSYRTAIIASKYSEIARLLWETPENGETISERRNRYASRRNLGVNTVWLVPKGIASSYLQMMIRLEQKA